ncbi:MAG: KOW domain-containing RNA-binding protein [Bacillota bacterium]|nr:KOW domain-containing RNA-binding protein [Bacillota bacterium]
MESAKDFFPGQIVFSKAGRDKGKAFVILAPAGDREVWIADGLGRTVEAPKRKKLKHLQGVNLPDNGVYSRLREGKKLENSHIREALRKYSREECQCPCSRCPCERQKEVR